MRNFIRKTVITILLLQAVLVSVCSTRVYAQTPDYAISGAEFIDSTQTQTPALRGKWNKAADKTNYTVRLYKGKKCLSSRVVKGTEIDFSSMIIQKTAGAGSYSFTVTTVKGGNTIESESLDVTAEMVQLVRDRISREQKTVRTDSGGRWEKRPGEIWVYYDKNGEQVKGRWLEVDGQRYYFDSGGIMLTGWHLLNGKYYYLEPHGTESYPLGAMWRSAVTPDGHQVDENGARTGEDTSIAKTKEQKVSVLRILLNEQQKEGTFSELLGVSCENGKVSNVSYSSNPKTWNGTTDGVITFDVKLNKDQKAASGLRAVCARASSVKILNSTSDSARIELHYTPKYQLETPSGLRVSPEGKVRWNTVKNASGYNVTVSGFETDAQGARVPKKQTYKVSSPWFELSGHGWKTEDTESVQVQALPSDSQTMNRSAQAKLTLPQ